MSRVLGIDPGFARVGLAVLDDGKVKDYKTWEPDKKNTGAGLPERLKEICEVIESVMYSVSPDVVVIESLFFGVNKKSAIAVAEARGAILVGIGMSSFDGELVEYAPQTIKKAVTGSGRADKKEMREALERIFGRKFQGHDDARDAIGAAFAYTVLGQKKGEK